MINTASIDVKAYLEKKLKKVVGLYDASSEIYIKRELLKLDTYGIVTEAIDIKLQKVMTDVPPCLIIVKNGASLSKLQGKSDSTKILNWVKSFIKVDE